VAEDTDTLEAHLAAANWKGGRSCSVCALEPAIRDQLDNAVVKARASAQSPHWREMTRWLQAKGVTMTEAKLQYHEDRGHCER